MAVQQGVEGVVADAHGVGVDGLPVHRLAAEGPAVLDPQFRVVGVGLGGGLGVQGQLGDRLPRPLHVDLGTHGRYIFQEGFA